MRVCLVGMGCAGREAAGDEARAALEEAELLVGAKRLVDALAGARGKAVVATRANDIVSALRTSQASSAAVLLGGDVGFFSGAARLRGLLEQEGHEVLAMPGISSVQLLAARLGRPWQDWVLASAHGRECDEIALLREGRPVFLLTSGAATVCDVCDRLNLAGLGTCQVTVAERLGYDDERVSAGTASQMAAGDYDDLNVMLLELPDELVTPRRTPGIPDEEFVRGTVPMTKQEVRACILAKLSVTPDEVCWDVGAGTGAVSVELALASGQVWAIERDEEALELVRRNRARHRAWNLHVVEGTAPVALAGLPRPDVVFVGGSAGRLQDILDVVVAANPNVRVCVAAIALQTLTQAHAWMEAHDMAPEVTQVAVSRTRNVHDLSLLMAQNPVFLVVGRRTHTGRECRQSPDGGARVGRGEPSEGDRAGVGKRCPA